MQRLKRRPQTAEFLPESCYPLHYRKLTVGRGSPIGLAGCGISLFFAVIFGIWAENRGGKRESQLRAGAGFRVFMVLGCGIRKGNRARDGISILTWPHKLLLTRAENTSWQKRTFCAYSCARFQVMTGWIVTALYSVRFCQMYSLSFSIIRLYELFVSSCDHLCSPRSLAVTFLSKYLSAITESGEAALKKSPSYTSYHLCWPLTPITSVPFRHFRLLQL